MIRLFLYPPVLGLLVLAAIGLWIWARRADVRVRLARMPTRQEWALLGMLAQFVRWLIRLRL